MVIVLLSVAALPTFAREKLTIRVSDAVGVPGGTAAIVFRTYASRPIEQGQLCLEAQPTQPAQPANPNPAQTTQGAQVFSSNEDALTNFNADLTSAVQQFVLDFTSPTASINDQDGPLAVIFIDLDPALVPGQTFDLTLDLPNTFLIDEFGVPIDIRPRNGVLTIRDPADPVVFRIETEDAAPGEVARVSLNTMESLPLSSGSFGIVYDPAIAAGPITAVSDPRYGNAVVSLDMSIPGLALIGFSSLDGSFNTIPGNIVSLLIPTPLTISPGSVSPLVLDPSASAISAAGSPLDLALVNGLLHFTGQVVGAAEIADLTLKRSSSQFLQLEWGSCTDPDGYSIYRGSLELGYASASVVPGLCAATNTTVNVTALPGISEFFLVVPYKAGQAGGYGERDPVSGACFPQEASPSVCPGSN